MDTLEQRIHELIQEALNNANSQPKYKTVQWYLQNKEGFREKANKWALESYYRNKEKVLAKKAERYKNDPEFRAKQAERARKAREKKKLEKLAESEQQSSQD
jgi:hypothetical protein